MTLRLLLLATVVTAVADEPYYTLSWPGPERGCSGVAGQGGLFSAECALPSGKITITADAAATYLKIACENDSTYSCEELQEAKQLLSEHFTFKHDVSTNRTVDRYEIKNCALPAEPLACALGLLYANDAKLLILDDLRGVLTPRHVEGMTKIEKLRNYYLNGSNETTMPYDVLAKLPSLSSFTLMRGAVELRGAREGGLPEMPALRMLELAEGGLRSLPRGAFANASGVTTLSLWGNQIEDIDEDAFAGLSQLVNLSLNSNQLSELPRALLRPCARLEHVDLYNNQLTALPDHLFRGLVHLKEVIIFDNRAPLQLGERAFAELPALQQLQLSSCGLQQLPARLLQHSTALQQLQLSGNNLTSLPPTVFHNLTRLTELKLGRNKLEHLPDRVFWTLERLKELDLRGNRLARLPDGVFAALRALKVLDLGNNRIETLDKWVFNGLSVLRELQLDGNRLATLHSDTFRPVSGLEILSLARNNLTISQGKNSQQFVPRELEAVYRMVGQDSNSVGEYHSSLRELSHLNELDLSHNRVQLVCDDWLALWNLSYLDLSHNELTELTESDMVFFSNGVTVDFTHNKIVTFRPPPPPPPPSPGEESPRPPTLLLQHNPLACDCRLYPYADMRRRSLLGANIVLDDAPCARPHALADTLVDELDPDLLVCNDTDCPHDCSCVTRPARDRVEVDCLELPSNLTEKSFTTHLRLRRPSDLTQLPAHVKYLDLSALNLTAVPKISAPVEIDLTRNQLTHVPMDMLRLNCVVHLADNPIDCSCGNKEELEFLRFKHRLVRDYRNLTCRSNLSLSGVDTDTLCTARDSTIIGCSVALFGVFIAVITGIAYRYMTEIRILLEKLGIPCGKYERGDRTYDAFVSFSHEDEKYVMETLVPKLEGGRNPLRLCLHYRDWVVGDFIPSQIARSVEDSRRTIIVLSNNFLKSIWAQMEFRAAHGRERLLVLMLDDLSTDKDLDPDLKAYIKVNTYVKADDPLVYDRLKDAVLRTRAGRWRTGKADRARGLDVRLNSGGQLVNSAFAA